MPAIGPAIACASAGSAPPIAPATCSATGSTSTCQTGSVFSIHSARLQAAEVAEASGNVVTGSSQCSASRTASATRSLSVGVTDRSPAAETVLRAMSLARSQFTGLPSVEPLSSCWT